MIALLKKIYRKFKNIVRTNAKPYDFNKSNPLGDNGERVDIALTEKVNFNKLDIYQKNHWKRYEFAETCVKKEDVVGDFACGTGYGSILLASKANKVIGADINALVISKIKDRYKNVNNVQFMEADLLELSYDTYFDTIVSFETLEHFKENDIQKLLLSFSKALKSNGRLIFSTPYMQEDSETAIKAGFHQTFYINEKKISLWLHQAGFSVKSYNYQNYDTHFIKQYLEKKEFIVGVAVKNN